jgi:hypothetical protein
VGKIAKLCKCIKCIGNRCIPRRFRKEHTTVATKLQQTFNAQNVAVTSGPTNDAPSEEDGNDDSKKQPLFDLLISLTDLYDEVQLMRTIPTTGQFADIVRDKLRDKIELAGGKLICGMEWNPKEQRAVKVVPSHTPDDPVRVTSTVSSGLVFNSAILRKQEVVISKPN